jgi:gliding motility-associated-like protein
MIRLLSIKGKTLLLLLLLSANLLASDPNTNNIGFESGDWTGWTGKTWTYFTGTGAYQSSPIIVSLPESNGRIVLLSDQTAYDVYTNNQLKIIPSGYTHCARLGCYKPISSNRGWDQSLEYHMTVSSANELLVIKFAVVLEYGTSNGIIHTALEQPRFLISLLDESGNAITNLCSTFDENTLTLDNTKTYTYLATYGSQLYQQIIVWRDWKTVSANLKSYEGKTITLKFASYDCTLGGHFGYAYLVVDTQPAYITTKFCNNDNDAELTAPEGFQTYTWKCQNNTIGTGDTCKVANAQEGDVYKCIFTTAAGCQDSLTTTIKRIKPVADFQFSTIDCNSSTNTVQFTDKSQADALHPSETSASISAYQWDFGDGNSSTEASPSHIFSTSGWQNVSLKITSYPSTCTASLDTTVETFYPPLIGIKGDSTYCPNLTTTLKGYGADHYRWILADGTLTDISDTIQIGAPGGIIGLRGYSKVEACKTTKQINVSEDPAWNLTVSGNPYFCCGGNTTLTASGDAVSYLWQPQNSSNTSVTIDQAGTYLLSATNQRGCIKIQNTDVEQIALPSVDFSVVPAIINNKYNTVTCTIPQESNISYSWDMGDGTTTTGTQVEHSYQPTGNNLHYAITLAAENAVYGCKNSATQIIITEPFVPNVFTPNNDGHNDRFMAGYDLKVFDRNGILVYEGNKLGNGWDGKYNGQSLDSDTYFYILQYTDYQNNAKTLKGYVTLVR